MRRLRKVLLRFVLPLVIVAAVLVWSPLLSIRRIDVTGHQRYTTEEIRAVSGLTQGEHVFLPLRWSPGKWPATRLQTVKRSVERLPWVAAVRVEWLPLHDIRIRVTERQPFARLPYLGGFLLLDPEGVVLEKQEEEEASSALIELRGVRFTGYANGHRPDLTDPEQMETGLRILKALQNGREETGPSLLDAVRWVDVLAYDRALVSLEDRITLRLDPSGDLQYMLDFASEIFFRHIRPEEKGMIDFTRGEDPSFIPD